MIQLKNQPKLTLFLGVILTILVVVKVHGQTPATFKNLSKKEGLSQVSVFSITEDIDGFLWFGTREGLNKYDGYSFKVFRSNSDGTGIAGNDVRCLFSDPTSGDLWIGTQDGLSLYDRSENSFRNFRGNPVDSTMVGTSSVSDILRDSANNVWVANRLGLHLLNADGVLSSKMVGDNKFGFRSINSIFIDSERVFWVGTENGLYQFDRKEKEFRSVSNSISVNGKNISTIAEGENDDMWIGTSDGGVTRWNRTTKLTKHYTHDADRKKSLSHDDVRTICVDEFSRIWIGTRGGLNLYNGKSDDFLIYGRDSKRYSGLSDKSVRSIHVDRKGSTWVGTYYGGVNHLDDAYNQFITNSYSEDDNGLQAAVISCFAEDDGENIWIGTEGQGLAYYNNKKKTYQTFTENDELPNHISGNNVKQVLRDKNGLWIGFYSAGIDYYDLRTKQFTNYGRDDGLSDVNVYDILKRDEWLWLATYAGGLNLLNPTTNEVRVYRSSAKDAKSLSSDFVRVIFESSNRDIWVGTSEGVCKVVVDSSGLPLSFEHFLARKEIYCIQEDSKSQLWIGTISNGIFKMDPTDGSVQHYSSEDGLSGNTVYGILEDEDGFLWISTNNGISRFNDNTRQFVNFNNANGLGNTEFNFNAYMKLSSGEFLFGAINGYTRFNPLEIEVNKNIPNVVFTEITQNSLPLKLEKNINEISELEFEHNKANFTLSFAALDFTNPSNNTYAYMLEGIDNDWNYTIGKPSATYTIQRAGEYIFKLRGGNSAGLWNEEVKELKIKVLKPFWFSWWACLMYGFIVLIGFFSIFRYIKLTTSLALERKEKEQIDNLGKLKMNFFTNVAHEFRTPLTLIMGPLEDLIKHGDTLSTAMLRSKLVKINTNAQRMLNLVNQLMTFRKMEAGYEPLSVHEVNLNQFLERIFELFSEHAILSKVTYNLITTELAESAWLDEEKIEQVLFNLLSNAFKFTPEGGEISLKLEETEGIFVIKVKDSGVGIDPENHDEIFRRFYEKNTHGSTNLIKGTGIGLSLSKQLVELHKGRIEVFSLGNEGAEFVVTLRKGAKHYSPHDFADIDMEKQYQSSITMAAEESVRGRLTENNATIKVMLVDDNPEILDYLTSILEGRYKIITAKNGREGLRMISEYQPDLIISDVMMPEMDGIQFCNAIRSNVETASIPIVLLSAKSVLDDKLAGLAAGANDFITKPFHSEELLLKVQNILHQTDMVKKSLNGVEFEPSELNITSSDQQFLKDLVQLMDDNIGNPEFKIEQFSQELAVSRALLFTKIKALTDMTPKNFLKSFRMKRAISLLETGKLSVHEVAYRVGYRDAKYFSKVFLKVYGKNPSEYMTVFKAQSSPTSKKSD